MALTIIINADKKSQLCESCSFTTKSLESLSKILDFVEKKLRYCNNFCDLDNLQLL